MPARRREVAAAGQARDKGAAVDVARAGHPSALPVEEPAVDEPATSSGREAGAIPEVPARDSPPQAASVPGRDAEGRAATREHGEARRAADPPAPMPPSDPAPSVPQADRPRVAWQPEAPSSHPPHVSPEATAADPGEPISPLAPPGEASAPTEVAPDEAAEATAPAMPGEPPQAAPAAPEFPAIADPTPHAVLREPPGWPAADPAGEPSSERDRGVSIGQIDVIVESPEPARPRSSARPSRSDGTSRHYLRRLR